MDDVKKDLQKNNDEQLARVVTTLREGSWRNSSLTDRIMENVRAKGALASTDLPWWRRGFATWMFTPRNFRVRPIAALATTGLVAAVAVGVVRSYLPSSGHIPIVEPARFASGTEEHPVQFVLVAPEAERVVLVGSFNDWDPSATPLVRDIDGGLWVAELRLPTGRHLYAFVVDGNEWVLDESAPVAPADEFGSPNSVLLVPVRQI